MSAEPEIRWLRIEAGMSVVMCTDGCNMTELDRQVTAAREDPMAFAEALVRGPDNKDNATALVLLPSPVL